MARGEPHSLNSGLGGLPGGGVRNQSSGSLVVRVEAFFPPPTSQLHIPLGFLLWTAGACWKLLFWELVVVGRTSGPSEAAVLSPSAQHPLWLSPLHNPPRTPSPTASECTWEEIFLAAASKETCLPHFL